jgi:hypothetical protein
MEEEIKEVKQDVEEGTVVAEKIVAEKNHQPILVQHILDRVMNKNKSFVLLFVGATGCLSGDTIINTSRNELGRPFTIKFLYNAYNGIHNPKCKGWDLSKPTFVRSFNGEIIKLNKIKNVFYSGKQKTYSLKLENGLSIKATSNHKFLTRTNGWMELSNLKGQEIMCDTLNAESSNRKRIKLRDIGLNVGKNHPYNNHPNGQMSVHTLIYEARMNNLKFIDYLDILLNESEICKKLKYVDPKLYTIHHKDECHYNNSIDNLELLPRQEHYFKHNEYTNFSQGIPKFSKVIDITSFGEEDTYDIECEEQYPNFVANGMVVHNSGKSYAALRLAELLDPTFDINRCCFKAIDFMNVVNDLVKRSEKGEVIKGKVLIWDEFGVEHNAREFMTISNRVINYFFQTSRHLNLIVIMTVPLLSFIDSATRKLCHGIAEMQGINSHDRTSTVKLKMLQTNVMTGKEYPKYLRYRKEHKTFKSKLLCFELPTKKLRDQYELNKKAFTTNLNIEIMNKLITKRDKENKIDAVLTETQDKYLKKFEEFGGDWKKVADYFGTSVQNAQLHVRKAKIRLQGQEIASVAV